MYSDISLKTKQKIKKAEDICIKYGLQKLHNSDEDFICYGFNYESTKYIVCFIVDNNEHIMRYADPDKSYLNGFNEYVSCCREIDILKTKSFEKKLHTIINENIKRYKELIHHKNIIHY